MKSKHEQIVLKVGKQCNTELCEVQNNLRGLMWPECRCKILTADWNH